MQERLLYVYGQEEAPLPWSAGAPFPVLLKAAGHARQELGVEAAPAAAEILLENVRVPAENLLGEPGEGFAVHRALGGVVGRRLLLQPAVHRLKRP